ncbi:MAG TPA: helix-turn-helix domain-containing protein [Candidatus Dormibacteraeota bacterium]
MSTDPRKADSTKKRPNRRQVSAAATRQEILLAARRLFAERGFARTSVAEIADEAGVSVPTIYASVGQKQAIVIALVGFIELEIGADEARALVNRGTDPVELLALAAHLNRVLQERFGDIMEALRSAAPVEPAVATAVMNGRRMHRIGSRRLADRLVELGALRQGVAVGEAADVIALLTDVENYSTLVGMYSWTFDRAEAWITETLCAILLQARQRGRFVHRTRTQRPKRKS